MRSFVAIAGAGLAGSVLARELAERGDRRVIVFEELDHPGGHCHTERDPSTGIMLHRFGAHVFHTSREDVWRYVNRFATFIPFVTRVKAVTGRGVFSLPINLHTINQLAGKAFSPREAKAYLEQLREHSSGEASSFEQQALRTVGREIYETFFQGYTQKQWGVDPKQLPASVLKRLPIRLNYDDNYFDDLYQGIPAEGYTAMISRMLDHPRIELRLGQRLDASCTSDFAHVFFTGPLDAFFGHCFGRLPYRSLRFERIDDDGDFQGGPLLTWCQPEVPFTRTVEHKHFAPWEQHSRTVVFREYSMQAGPDDPPFYPIRLVDDVKNLEKYQALAAERRDVTFLGRLGTYRYLDMHIVVSDALALANRYLATSAVNPSG